MNIDIIIGLNSLAVHQKCLICGSSLSNNVTCNHLIGNRKKKMQFRNGKIHVVAYNHIEDLTLQHFGNWKVLDFDENSKKYKCECQCELHTVKLVASSSLKNGTSTSCRKCNQSIFAIGTIIGNWEVVGKVTSDHKIPCKCHCGYCDGQTKLVDMYQLLHGKTHGCSLSTNKGLTEDIAGQIFGNWKAIKNLGHSMWLCECQCENKTISKVSLDALKSGKSQSCGCLRNKYKLIDLTNQKFGKLVAIRYIGEDRWLCKCDCGNSTIKYSHNLRRSSTISCGCNDNKPLSQDYIISKLKAFKEINNRYPFRNEIETLINRSQTTVSRYIEKYNLQSYIQTTFNSYYEYELSKLYDNMQVNKFFITSDNKKLQLDLWDMDKNVAIEFNGSYWHSENMHDKNYHQYKTIEATKRGIRLIHIFEYEWVDKVKKEKIISLINNALNNVDKQVIYARNTVIKHVDTEEKDVFINKYHLQNSCASSINIGCYYNDELVGIMTFGKPRFSNHFEYELIRFCWKDTVRVIGGAEKIFKYFIKNYNPNSIVSYCDISKFSGNTYFKLGFTTSRDYLTSPNYVWVNAKNEVLARYKTQKHNLIKLGLGCKEQTENEIMESLGFWKVYDCGNLRFEWTKHIV